MVKGQIVGISMRRWRERQGVVVKLRLRGEEAQRLGLLLHVCEVQLVPAALRPLLQDPSVHARYLCFRNARAHTPAGLLRAALWWAGRPRSLHASIRSSCGGGSGSDCDSHGVGTDGGGGEVDLGPRSSLSDWECLGLPAPVTKSGAARIVRTEGDRGAAGLQVRAVNAAWFRPGESGESYAREICVAPSRTRGAVSVNAEVVLVTAWCSADTHPPGAKGLDRPMVSLDECRPMQHVAIQGREVEISEQEHSWRSVESGTSSLAEVRHDAACSSQSPSSRVCIVNDESRSFELISQLDGEGRGIEGADKKEELSSLALGLVRKSAMAVFHRSCECRGSIFSGKYFDDTLANASSLWFTSKPAIVASSRPIFRLVCLGISALFFFRSASFSAYMASNGVIQPATQHFRLRILALQDPSLPPSLCNLLAFGLLRGGCEARPLGDAALGRSVGNGSSPVTISLPAPIGVNGFYLQVLSGDAQRDPSRWVVEAASGGEGEWRTVAASFWTVWGTTVRFHPEIPTKLFDRDRRATMDMRPPWMWAMTEMGVPLTSSCFWLVIAVAGSARRHDLAKATLETMFCVVCVLSFTVAVGHFAAARWLDGVTSLIIAISSACVAAISFYAQKFTIHAFAVYGTLNLGNMLVQSIAVFKDMVGLASSMVVNGGFFAILFICLVLFFRYRALYRARRLVLDDKHKYDEIWSALMLDSSQQMELQSVSEEAARINSMIMCPARHFHRKSFESVALNEPQNRKSVASRVEEVWDHALSCGIPCTNDLSRPVHNLDQLYVQATALQALLISKVQAWAAESEGYFLAKSRPARPSRDMIARHVRFLAMSGWGRASSDLISLAGSSAGTSGLMSADGAHFLRWKDVCGVEDAVQQVKWSSLKSPHRAIEKATRSYGQDVSLLVDLCRQSIYFDSFSAVARCLATISRDHDVVLARIKNRLDPSHDASATAGFRNLSVNLRLVSHQAALLGADTHVCELQLLLLSFARIKNEDGHKKYIAFRNLRGE